MPKRLYKINDPDFSQFLFEAMSRVPKKILAELDDKELRIFRNQKTMRRFADNDGWEEKILLLARIGISFTMTFAPLESRLDELMEKVQDDNLDKSDRLSLIKAMAEDQIFVISSKDILLSSHMMAQNSHHQVYVLSYPYLEVSQKLADLKSIQDPFNMKYKGVQQGFDDMAAILLATLRAEDAIKVGAGVTTGEMKVLLALYGKRTGYMHSDELASAMGESMRSFTAFKTYNALVRSNHIIHLKNKTSTAGRSSHYMITEKGINAVSYYIKYILKKTDFS